MKLIRHSRHHKKKKTKIIKKDVKICGNLDVNKDLNIEGQFNSKGDANFNYAFIDDLQINTLNGKGIDCDKPFNNSNSQLVEIDYSNNTPIKPKNPGIFNQKVWDQLWIKAVEDRDLLANSLLNGRQRIQNILLSQGCSQSCPPEDINIPLKIFGIQTVSPINRVICGASADVQMTQLISSMSYNFDVVNATENLASRVLIILVQVGWLDENDNFQYEEIDLAIRQFSPSLHQLYGEKYTGSVILPTDQMLEIAELMPFDGNSAAVQMIVYGEEGLLIDRPILPTVRGFRTLRNADVTSSGGPVDTQYVGQSVGGQLQWANIYSNYSFAIDNIVSLETTFNLSQGAPSTQWVMGWLFQGPPPATGGGAGGYFGINTDDQGNYQVLASIFNVALGANIGDSFVTPVKFGGEGEGWSLRITTDNISNFPITLNNTYKMRLDRENVNDTEVTWKFIITNVDTSQSVDLGTIRTSATYSFINKTGEYQFSEYFGPGAPNVTCQSVPKSVVTWTFPIANDTQNSATFIPWTPPPQLCGIYNIDPTLPNGPVIMTFGGSP